MASWGIRCGRALPPAFAAAATRRAAVRQAPRGGCAASHAGRCRLRACLRRLAGQRHHVPAQGRAVVQIGHRREDVGAEGLLRMVDGHRRVEQRAEILPHIDLLFLAADEDRNRPLGRGVSGFDKRGRLGRRCRRRVRRRIERYRRRRRGAAQLFGRGGRSGGGAAHWLPFLLGPCYSFGFRRSTTVAGVLRSPPACAAVSVAAGAAGSGVSAFAGSAASAGLVSSVISAALVGSGIAAAGAADA